MDRDALDRYITSGRYQEEQLRATCGECGVSSAVIAETEYGATTWTPEECPACYVPFDENTVIENDEPDPDILYDRMREEGVHDA